MKRYIEHSIQIALKCLQETGIIPAMPAFIQVEVTKNKKYGDFYTNVAMILAKLTASNPIEIAKKIVEVMPKSIYLQATHIAPPGFINFYLSQEALFKVVVEILTEKEQYGRCTIGRGKRILVEYVSSNPTGPLHVGHGRHAAYGSSICKLLDAVGFKCYSEYYINDAGRQMDILAVSIWLRYLALFDPDLPFPAHAYQGKYIQDIALQLKTTDQILFYRPASALFNNLPPIAQEDNQDIDHLILRAKALLGDQLFDKIISTGLEIILADIRNDLEEFGVHFDHWFSERQFIETGVVDTILEKLQANGHVYLHEGAWWFRATAFGDDKDRVLIRHNGQKTYFANDLAYHIRKFERGFDIVLDIIGADHHGYIPRIKAGLQAYGIHSERLIYLLGQFVTLYHHGEPISMSTRSGEFIPLRTLRQEVGNEVARFFYIMRKYEQHIDFDLDIAKSHSNENPLYYIQYAYARICSVFKQVTMNNHTHGDPAFNETMGLEHLPLLIQSQEKQLLTILSQYPDMIINAALHYEPHILTHYLRDIATYFHAYYSTHQLLVAEESLRYARLALAAATRQVLLNGLRLLGIEATETM